MGDGPPAPSRPMSDSDQPGRGGGVDFPQCNPANSGVISNNLEFIAANYASAQESSQTYGVPADWILGWAALESSSNLPKGTCTVVAREQNNGDNNFFGMTGSGWIGQTSCAVTVTSSSGTFACFASFLASANAALGSKYGQILATDYAVGDTAPRRRLPTSTRRAGTRARPSRRFPDFKHDKKPRRQDAELPPEQRLSPGRRLYILGGI